MFEPVRAFLEDVNTVESIPELEAMLRPLLAHYHIEHFLCTNIEGLACLADLKPMFGFWDTDWINYYVSNGFYRDDPLSLYPNGLENDGRPYYWSDLVARTKLSKAQERVMAEAWNVGLKDGLLIPLRVSDTELANVSFSGPRFKKDPLIAGILHTIALQAHRVARMILLRSYPEGLMPNLLAASPKPAIGDVTMAEREVIRYLASDFDVKDIAMLRGVSVNTINKQIRSAKEKLRVEKNSALVYIARNFKLIR